MKTEQLAAWLDRNRPALVELELEDQAETAIERATRLDRLIRFEVEEMRDR